MTSGEVVVVDAAGELIDVAGLCNNDAAAVVVVVDDDVALVDTDVDVDDDNSDVEDFFEESLRLSINRLTYR